MDDDLWRRELRCSLQLLFTFICKILFEIDTVFLQRWKSPFALKSAFGGLFVSLEQKQGESVTINIPPISTRKSSISSYGCCRNRFPCTFKFRHVPLKSNRDLAETSNRMCFCSNRTCHLPFFLFSRGPTSTTNSIPSTIS